jgi:peptide chain release factor 2
VEAEKQTMAPDFWEDSKKAEALLKEIKSIKIWTDDYEAVQQAVADTEVLFDFYREGDVTATACCTAS